MIVVYTCILNDWDYLRKGAMIDASRYICFTDRPLEPVAPWEIQPAYWPRQEVPLEGAEMPASRASRLPKILPHLHFEADYSIWHDANFTLSQSPESIVSTYLQHADIAMFAHPCRKHVGEECAVLLKEKIGDPTEVEAARTLWKHHGAPLGLWAGGLILRRHTKAVQDFNESWWQFYRDGSSRDQISLPVARAQCGIEITTIPGDIYTSPIMGFHWHAAWRDKAENQKYQTQEAAYQMRRRRLEEMA